MGRRHHFSQFSSLSFCRLEGPTSIDEILQQRGKFNAAGSLWHSGLSSQASKGNEGQISVLLSALKQVLLTAVKRG